MESARVDQRREMGMRTRARLLDAALDLIAECGEEGVTSRARSRMLLTPTSRR
jgi:AcrR family transcriptional regulator